MIVLYKFFFKYYMHAIESLFKIIIRDKPPRLDGRTIFDRQARDAHKFINYLNYR